MAKAIAIIGGGYAGLSAALQLTSQGHRVTLYERSSRPGGLVGSFSVGGTPLERFYHHFFTSDRYLINLATEMGLGNKVTWFLPKTASYYQGKIYSFKTARDLLRFSPLPLVERLRMGLLVLDSAWRPSWEGLDELTAKDWIISRVGTVAYRVLWEPLLVSKFGAEAETVSAAWLWSKLKLRGSSRNQRGQETLGYFRPGGFAQLTEAVTQQIERRGGRFVVNSEVSALTPSKNDGWSVVVKGKKPERYDAVIFTAAPPILSALLPATNPKYHLQLENVGYQANICAVMVMKRPLSDVYWLNVLDKTFPFVAVVEHTNLLPKADYGDKTVVYLSRYLSPTEPLWQASDDVVKRTYLDALKKIFSNFDEQMIEQFVVSRARYTQPITPVHYRQTMLGSTTPYPGLYLASMSQVYPQDRGTNYAIKIGQEVAAMIDRS